LTHQTIDEWRRWDRRQSGILRNARAHLRAPGELCVFESPGGPSGDRRVVAGLDSLSPSHRSAILGPLERLRKHGVGAVVIAPSTLSEGLRPLGFERAGHADRGVPASLRGGISGVIAVGDHLQAGAVALQWAEYLDVPYFVAQHGLITPACPPVPPGSHLLAWTEADARFMVGKRQDVTVAVVGSQILWESAQLGPHDAGEPCATVHFLGQLHTHELPRQTTARTVRAVAREQSTVYRPHPNERDVVSRLQHRVWRNRGLILEANASRLGGLSGQVVAIFSTGILEAAAAGVPAFGACWAPPRWVEELWDRYQISRFDSGVPTVVEIAAEEPALTVAGVLQSIGPR
jgi:hypothetical protein